MTIWQIILIICGAITAIAFIFGFIAFLLDEKKFKEREWWMVPAMLFIIPMMVFYLFMELWEYLSEVWKDGGFRKHYQLIREHKAAYEAEQKRKREEETERKRIRIAYLNGLLTREELPRAGNGKDTFEFEMEMGLSVEKWDRVHEIVYVENEYNERLNSFFLQHQDLRLYHMYKFVYLPIFSKVLGQTDLQRYLYPNKTDNCVMEVMMDSSYPIQYLWYKEDAVKIKHGMMYFVEKENCGAKYIKGQYYHLEEGSDEEIIAQLDEIVKKVHSDYGEAALYCTIPSSKHPSPIITDEVAGIAQEIRERIAMLREMGMGRKFIKSLLDDEPKLSRLVITKDLRIVLPDYNDMEIKMEPINKAVFLLFLRHPEGIVFKHLPDYRKELAELYQKIKPLGLNDRAIQSIEDVSNPLLNSINEKCARIRGAFISQFDENLARHYYIYGVRGEAKKISLPRDLVVWE